MSGWRCSRTGHGRPATGNVSLSPRAILANAIIEHGADAGPHQQREVALCGRLRFRLNLISLMLGQGWQAHHDSEMRSEEERGRRHGRYIVARKRVVILYLGGLRPGKQTCFVPKSEFGTGPCSDSDALPRSPCMCAYPQLAAPQSIVLAILISSIIPTTYSLQNLATKVQDVQSIFFADLKSTPAV